MLFLTHALRIYGTDVSLVDDAFIFFRYAKHWAEGHGLVWNVGEPPVEGVSSLLYTALLALGIRAGLDVVLWATVVNLLLGAGLLGLALALGRGLDIPTPYRYLAPLLIASSADVAFWTGAGMDVILFTAVLMLSLWLTVTERPTLAGISFAFLAMARLDAVPLALVTWLVLLWRTSRTAGNRPLLSTLFSPSFISLPSTRFLLAFAGFFVPFYLARWAYFGWPLPNSYYAKTGGGLAAWREGLLYTGAFLRRPEVVVVVVLAFLGGLARRDWRGHYVGVVAVLLLVRAVAAGGDWMPRFRFMVPLWPLLAVLAAQGVATLLSITRKGSGATPTDEGKAHAAAGPGSLLLFFILTGLLLVLTARPSLEYIAKRPWRLWRPPRLVEPMHASQYAMGLALREVICPDDTIALLAAGAAAYLNDDHVIIDMLGLSDVHIAHSPPILYKGEWDSGHTRLDVDYILAREPEWIQLDTHLFPTAEFRLRDWMPPQVLWGDARVREQYEFFPLRVEVPTNLPQPRVGYIWFLHKKGAPVCGESR